MATGQEKENSKLKPIKFRLNDLVSHPARAEGLGKYTRLENH